MNATAKSKIKEETLAYFRNVNDIQEAKVTWIFAPNMAFARFAVYVVALLTVSTWVYAAVAPESFSRTTLSVKHAVDASLEALNIKSHNDIQTTNTINHRPSPTKDVGMDAKIQSEINRIKAEERPGKTISRNKVKWPDTDDPALRAKAALDVNIGTKKDEQDESLINIDTDIAAEVNNTGVKVDINVWKDIPVNVDIDTDVDVDIDLPVLPNININTTTTPSHNNGWSSVENTVKETINWGWLFK